MQFTNKATLTGVAFVSVIVVIVAALALTGSGVLSKSAPSTAVVGGSGSVASACDQPTYLLKLASQVEQASQFISQSHGLSYVFEYGNNESAETGTADVGGVEEPIYYSPSSELAFYSYGAAVQTGSCYNTAEQTGHIIGALWVTVPVDPNGSYDLANTSVYFTPGLFSNGTSTANLGGASSPESGDISCACQPTYTFAEGNSTTIIAAPTQTPALLTGQFTVDANSSIPVRLGLLDTYNGTLTVPSGSNITVNIGSQTFILQPGADPFTTPNPLIIVPEGTTAVHYTITIPPDSPAGSYSFALWMASFSNATATFMTYSDAYFVTLIVQ